jgi:hypothetical protein
MFKISLTCLLMYKQLEIFVWQDEHLLKGVSLTERIKLWDKFNSRINQHTVKLNFMNKIHRESPPFRIKVKHPKRKSLAVIIKLCFCFILLNGLVEICFFIYNLKAIKLIQSVLNFCGFSPL